MLERDAHLLDVFDDLHGTETKKDSMGNFRYIALLNLRVNAEVQFNCTVPGIKPPRSLLTIVIGVLPVPLDPRQVYSWYVQFPYNDAHPSIYVMI
jgi:hypothetical protein